MNETIITWFLCSFNFLFAGINLGLYISSDDPVQYMYLACFVFSSTVAVWVMKD